MTPLLGPGGGPGPGGDAGDRARRLHRQLTLFLSAALVCLGFSLIMRTAVTSGGGLGYLIGALMTGAGAGRLRLILRKPGGDDDAEGGPGAGGPGGPGAGGPGGRGSGAGGPGGRRGA